MNTRTKTVTTMRYRVFTKQHHIDDGVCGLPGRCMEKLANEEALLAAAKNDKGIKGRVDFRVKIDAGLIKFNYKGHRWQAITPKKAKLALIQFDKESRARAKAKKDGLKFVSKVKPHDYWVEAEQMNKIIPFTAERMKQVYAARDKRRAEGRPDRTNYNLRKRVTGFGNV